MADITITDAERKRLLHAYETLMFEAHRPLNESYELCRLAWADVCEILLDDNDELACHLHGLEDRDGLINIDGKHYWDGLK